jgi:hypothetical protein
LSVYEKDFASPPPASMTTETLDDRVQRLAQILAASRRHVETNRDESQGTAALKHFSASLGLIQQLTAEVRSRIGSHDWDASDALTARMLLDALSSAVHTCRVVSDAASSRLVEVERTMKKANHFIHREEVTRR